MKSFRNTALFFTLLLFCSSTHSFWGEQRVHSIFSWLYSLRISQFFLKKLGHGAKTPLEVIETMLEKRTEITLINQLDEDTQNLLLKDYKASIEEKTDRVKIIQDLYLKNNFFSLATMYGIIDQFINHQTNFLHNSAWTKDTSKQNCIDRLFDEKNPSFYTERRILKEDAKTYLAADLHGDPSPVLDILAQLIIDSKFNTKTGKLSKDIYLSLNGDFVDKGLNGSACLLLIYSLKLLNPNQVIITRGNHEDPEFLKIDSIKEDHQKNRFDFGAELYYKYYHNQNRLMSFLFSPDTLKKALSKSYAVMPVMAFLLHKTDRNDKFCGYVASHAGLDPAYNPEDLLTQNVNERIFFDEYKTQNKLHPKNTNCKNALINELVNEYNIHDHVSLINTHSMNQYKNRLRDSQTLEKKQLNENQQENFEQFKQTMQKNIMQLSNFNKLLYENPQYVINHSLYLQLSSDPLTNKEEYNIKMFEIETTEEGKKIFKPNHNNFNPFGCINTFQNLIYYFERPIKSIKDIAACWHWKEPDTLKPSIFSGEYGKDQNFTMSYDVFKALMKDYQTEKVTLRLATQGHIQSAGLDYNEPSGQNQKAIFKGYGYGDVWQDASLLPFDSKNLSNPHSHEVFCKTRKLANPANPCIAASCGSIYGCEQNKDQFETEKAYLLNKCKTEEEKADVNKRYKSKNRYPGQTYNPIVNLWYNEKLNSICASQAVVLI